MSYFLCPGCGTRSEIFSHGGGRAEADRLGVPFLGEIPLDMVIRETSDGGNPVVVSDPDAPQTRVYGEIASRLWSGLSDAASSCAAPAIIVE